ncbi:MAG: cytochrome c [Myxococcota bacterium]
MKRSLLSVFVTFAALLVGCGGPAVLAPTEADLARISGRWPDASLAQLTEGHRTYRARCSSCHRTIAPSELAPEDWPDAVADMRERARLTPADEVAVTRFLVAASLYNPGGASQDEPTAPAEPALSPPQPEGPTR